MIHSTQMYIPLKPLFSKHKGGGVQFTDEPTGNLDSKMGAEVMELLHKLNKEDGRTIVMVTHNEEQAKQTSRTIRFFDGRQVQ